MTGGVAQPDAPADLRRRGVVRIVGGQRKVDACGWLYRELRVRKRLGVIVAECDEDDFERTRARRQRRIGEYGDAAPCG